jgi:hypothetical protein
VSAGPGLSLDAGPAGPGAESLHAARGRLRALLAGRGVTAGAVDGDGGPPLEAQALGNAEPARVVAARPLEGHALRARRVGPAPAGEAPLAFTAFLDGTQSSHALWYHDGLPIVWGTVAAVVRARRQRAMGTWGSPRVERRLYAPCRYLPPAVCGALDAVGVPVRDTTEPGPDGAPPPSHPIALLDRAVHFVQADRERAERDLAEGWCARQSWRAASCSSTAASRGASGSPRRAACSAWSRATARCTPRATRCAWCSPSAAASARPRSG